MSKISSELYHDLLKLVGIPNNTEREGVAAAYLDDGLLIDLEPQKEGRSYCIYATEEDGNCMDEPASFEDKATARKFVDALILLAEADKLAGGNV